MRRAVVVAGPELVEAIAASGQQVLGRAEDLAGWTTVEAPPSPPLGLGTTRGERSLSDAGKRSMNVPGGSIMWLSGEITRYCMSCPQSVCLGP